MRRHVGAAGAHHRQRIGHQRTHVDAGRSRRHQAERRQYRVAPADGRLAMEGTGKALPGCHLLQRRAGIGHRDEAVAGLVLANRLCHAVVEIILHRIRLGGAAGLAGYDEQRLGDIDRLLHRAYLRRIGGIEHVQLRKARLSRKSFRQHFGPEARSAHAEHDSIGEFLPLHAARKILVVGDVGFPCAVEPAEPFVLVIAGPHRLVLLPQPANFRRGTPIFRAFRHGLAEPVAKRKGLRVNAISE